MKFRILILLTLVIFTFSCARKHEKIEIYLAENVSPNYSSAMDSICRYCFELDKTKLSASALIRTMDIEYFNWKEQRIQLTKTGFDKISKLKIPMEGLPTVLTVNGNPVYGLWLWNYYSSFACDRICTFPQQDFKILFGFPEQYRKGSDPRFNEELKASLLKLDLLK